MLRGVAAAGRHTQSWRQRRRWAVALAALVATLAAGWWWGRGLQAAWTARQLVEAVKRGDCGTATKYSDVVALPEGCPPSLYGLPADLHGYSLSWSRVPHDDRRNETAVSLTFPGVQSQYGFHMVRKGEGWIVKDTIVLL